MKKDITAIGEILIDLTQTGVNEQKVPVFAANPGGAPANVCVAASRLGAHTAMIGQVGSDGFGLYLKQVLQDNQVDTAWLCTADQHTTMAIVTLDEQGERHFQFVRGADSGLSLAEIDPAALCSSAIFHFGSVSLTQEPARSTTLSAVSMAKEQGALISYDPNYRANLWPNREEAIRWMKEPLPLVDILKLSDEELPLLTGQTDPEAGCRLLAEQGISLVLLTLGGEGAFGFWQGQSFLVPGVSTTMADTNGAGDTFLGAVLSRLCRRDARPLENLTLAELTDIVAFANRAAAMTCSRSGAIPAMPTLAELSH